MNKKICIVTGSTSGIGKETALELARLGATVIIHGRDRKRGEKIIDNIRNDAKELKAELIISDFSTLEGVKEFAEEFKERYDRLDVLINNAGILIPERRITSYGAEMTFAVNHVAPFLLTHLLLDIIKKSKPSRIINVSSTAHWGPTINFDDLLSKTIRWKITNNIPIKGWREYQQSKLANICFTYMLSKRLQGTGVTVNALHPGTIRTRILRERKIINTIMNIAQNFRITGKQLGSETPIYLATSKDIEGITGKYYSNMKETKTSTESNNQELQKKLWEVSMKIIEDNLE